ncbi:MAG: aromatic ring-hydroxylating dioxygenase subunit alpha, partial [Rhodospirillales bacterium]|nr:aromatic ring-hydroxylating dioxygenase subunit alpha [Rhodospirillales bacterium]
TQRAQVRSYPTVERQEFIWIWTGDPELADETKIVDYPWNDDYENWPHTHGLLYIKCNYMLLIDNLMDLTHIPFVHQKTIGGGGQMDQVDAEMDVVPTDMGVHFVRWMMGITPPPTYVKGAGFAEGAKVDRWQDFEYIAPTSVLLWTGAHEVGKGARQDRDQPGGFKHRVYHGVTPETEESCFYFWAPSNGYKTDDPEATKILHSEIAATFAEDVDFLEAQQACMAREPGRAMVNTKHDAARMPARQAVERMIRTEIEQRQAAE